MQTHPTATAAGLPIWWVRSTRQRVIYHDSQADIFVVAAKIGRGRKLKDYVYIVSSDLRPTEIGEQVSRKRLHKIESDPAAYIAEHLSGNTLRYPDHEGMMTRFVPLYFSKARFELVKVFTAGTACDACLAEVHWSGRRKSEIMIPADQEATAFQNLDAFIMSCLL